MTNETVKHLLAALAAELDRPDGPGSGAVLLDALTIIEQYEQRHPPT
jgi:hypothetical protein